MNCFRHLPRMQGTNSIFCVFQSPLQPKKVLNLSHDANSQAGCDEVENRDLERLTANLTFSASQISDAKWRN